MYKDLVYKLSDDDFIKLFNESVTYLQFYAKLGFKQRPGKKSRDRILERCNKLNIAKKKRTVTISKIGLSNIVTANSKRSKLSYSEKHCSVCGKPIQKNKSNMCMCCYKKQKHNNTIELWKSTGNTGCGINTTLRNCIRDYIYTKQNYKCAICGLPNSWNNKTLNFVLDHIDGDAGNNNENNLRLICPNCDSQLPTFKSKNKKSARTARK